MKLRIGDEVLVTAGKDKGKKGKVKRVYPKTLELLVDGINQVVKHRKPMMGKPGERVTIEKPINFSKLAIINRAGERDRVGYNILKDGTKVRVYKKSGELIDLTKEKKVKDK